MAVQGSMVSYRPPLALTDEWGVTVVPALVLEIASNVASLLVFPEGRTPYQIDGVRFDALRSVPNTFSELAS